MDCKEYQKEKENLRQKLCDHKITPLEYDMAVGNMQGGMTPGERHGMILGEMEVVERSLRQ